MNVPELSLVIPCHNEEKNLQPLISAIRAVLDPLALDYEVVITDDCSTDNSWDVLKQLAATDPHLRSEEHTSELQSQSNLVCRLLLEKKKTQPQPTLERTHY